jgi:eukaryotic-like serine/threonine-protein kinase
VTSAQWELVKELFEAALDRRRADRSAFIAEACGDDQKVRQEVESLLKAHERDSDFMNEPVCSLVSKEEPILASGQEFGHYKEISLLGEGGMGQVYVAVDTRLGRKVALKLLPSSFMHDPAHVNRLEQEARAASALNHPNIITIHEIGEIDSIHFITTEFVDGETLRERMSRKRMKLDEVLDVAAQVASALQAAHELGIVHRDVKPENVMLRRDGVVKVLDFGLAKLAPQPLSVEVQTVTLSRVQTNAGQIMGTIGYMSPEQARGGDADLRTDVWSLGVVLYEMIEGRAPFEGENPSDVINAIRHHEAPPLRQTGIPRELSRIVTKALSKKPSDRYKAAGEMAFELKNLKEELTIESRLKRIRTSDANHDTSPAIAEQLSIHTDGERLRSTADLSVPVSTSTFKSLPARIKRHKAVAAIVFVVLSVSAIAYIGLTRNKTNPVASSKKSVAVLPFKPVDAAHRDEIFESGIADTLIQRLSSTHGFVVRSLSATRGYRDLTQDPLAAGKEQQVDYVISTSYQLAHEKIRITTDVINIASGETEQTYQFEKDSTDLFAMQEAIALEIGNKFQRQFGMSANHQTAKRGTTNREAYQLYLQGMYLANKRNLNDARKSVEALEQAVSLDPHYARAWAGLAYAHRTLSLFTTSLSTRETYEKSIAAINKALSLDENLSEAHSALCENKYLYEWDFVGAELECKRAIELDPNSAQAHEIYSRYLMGRARHEEAIAEIETAVDLEPTSRFIQRNYGRAFLYARRYPEAIAQFKRVLEMDDQSFFATYSWLIGTLALQGNEAEAFDWFLKLLSARKADEKTVQIFKTAFQTSGWRGVLSEWVQRFDQIGGNTFDGALHNAQIGNKDKAFEYLEKVYQRREIWMAYLRADPRLDPLRDDPRFADLLKRVESK